MLANDPYFKINTRVSGQYSSLGDGRGRVGRVVEWSLVQALEVMSCDSLINHFNSNSILECWLLDFGLRWCSLFPSELGFFRSWIRTSTELNFVLGTIFNCLSTDSWFHSICSSLLSYLQFYSARFNSMERDSLSSEFLRFHSQPYLTLDFELHSSTLSFSSTSATILTPSWRYSIVPLNTINSFSVRLEL